MEDELPPVPEDIGTTVAPIQCEQKKGVQLNVSLNLGTAIHPTRFMYSPIQRQFLVFGELYETIALHKDIEGSFSQAVADELVFR